MAKPLNSGYVGRKMSKRGYEALQKGELPLSMLTQKKLLKVGIAHSLSFIRWLCKRGYIKPTSWHHRGCPPTLTRFYHPKRIARQIRSLPIDGLLEEWKEWRGY